jgi:formate dehydrogenase major subunit
MTNHWIDIKNSDCILIMGSNAAENHPISFKYVTEGHAKRRHADQRGSPFHQNLIQGGHLHGLRSGTDIAFLGGMIKYILDNNLYQKEYVRFTPMRPLSSASHLASRTAFFGL